MILGICQFDAHQAQLKNLASGELWLLPRAELQVLKLLLAHRGSVVAKQKLGAADENHPALSDSSVTRAVFMLRSFLGTEHEHLIETVKGRGYRLRRDTRSFKQRWLVAPKLKAIFTIVILGFAVLLVMVSLNQYKSAGGRTEALNNVNLLLSSGQSLNLMSFSKSKTNNEPLLVLVEQLKAGFKLCHSTPWQQVYLSLSHDKQVFNITMKGEKLGQSKIRNLKLTDYRQQKQFISQAWLDEVDICE
ncbi:helix-turn-helix domain-containing protein [Shewanella sp. D64]|uniref:winged helix-turn-helix domain-containing protein n=1 Tax=unclassified Shewanella TaxID=196818 RepID=UPI0022BA1EF9|nr:MULTISPECIES: helix-turn-helix domain-containing protein [unclassified Shewanella]MEC4728212.1 helix-turn-helix domain-containing protein [Shewanella sp. D64]MEC4740009.1 helix-turn-helix domain-containing protein [Shewanella sp. E94]WBJ94365.1 helix-turn-helix domain-containing protein [Shewanella sp. MTB7]